MLLFFMPQDLDKSTFSNFFEKGLCERNSVMLHYFVKGDEYYE